MGDRANIAVIQPDGKSAVYIYSHWDGLEGMFKKLQKALKRKQRWDDHSYLCRIIIAEVIRDDLDSDTGYGVATEIGDNEHPILVVNPQEGYVGLAHEDAPLSCKETHWTMEEYCKLEWNEEFDS